MALSNTAADGVLSALIPRWCDNEYLSLFVHHNPIWMKMLLSGAIQTGGFGSTLREPLRYPRTTGPQMETVSDTLEEVSTQFMPGKTAADFTPTKKRMDYALDLFEASQFGSETEMVHWAEGHAADAMDIFMVGLEQEMWADEDTANSGGDSDTRLASILTFLSSGTTTATDGGAKPAALAQQSIAPRVGTSGASAVTTIGSIQRAAVGAAYLAVPQINAASSVAFTMLELSRTYSLARVNSKSPNIICVTRSIWDAIQNLASLGGSNGGQFQNDSRLADLGFDAIRFLNADVVYDDLCPTSGFISGTATATNHNILCINTDYIKLRMREKKPNFRKVDDAREITRFVAAMMLQLTFRGAGRYHSRHSNITAP